MMSTLLPLLQSYKSGMSLPQGFYTDEALFAADMQQVFQSQWLFAGHSCEVKEAGEYFTLTVGKESLIVVRDREGELRAFFNVCRHRGSKLVTDAQGCAKALVCPYHGWAYDLDGELKAARFMGDIDLEDYPLVTAHVREVAGLVFVCLAAEAPTLESRFENAMRAIAPQLSSHRLERAKVAGRDRYIVNANWKTIIENNRECYHCQVAHPEFMAANYDSGLPGDNRSNARFQQKLNEAYRHWERIGLSPSDVSFPDGAWFRIARFPLKDGFITESFDGQMSAPLMGDLADENVGSLRLVGLPNFWGHANADYAMTTRLLPISASQTQVDVVFLVNSDAVEGVDYDLKKVSAVWRATSEQDWQLCENNYAGICSLAYQPGILSPSMEASVVSFLEWYIQKLQVVLENTNLSSTVQPKAFNRNAQVEALSSVP